MKKDIIIEKIVIFIIATILISLCAYAFVNRIPLFYSGMIHAELNYTSRSTIKIEGPETCFEDMLVIFKISNLNISRNYTIIDIFFKSDSDLISWEDIGRIEIFSFDPDNSTELIFLNLERNNKRHESYRLYYNDCWVFLEEYLASVEITWKC